MRNKVHLPLLVLPDQNPRTSPTVLPIKIMQSSTWTATGLVFSWKYILRIFFACFQDSLSDLDLMPHKYTTWYWSHYVSGNLIVHGCVPQPSGMRISAAENRINIKNYEIIIGKTEHDNTFNISSVGEKETLR